MSRTMRYGWWLTATLVAGGVALAGIDAVAQAPAAAADATPPAPVGVALAERATFAPQLWVPASVVGHDDARVASEQDGRVISVAPIGDWVERGGALARLDDSLLRLQERRNAADIARIEAQLEYARSQETRLATLVQRASIAGAQLDEARAQRGVLEQQLASARVERDETRLRLRNSTVRAPFAGTVAERFVQPGEYLVPGAPVVRLVDTRTLEVRARAPVNLAGRLVPGQRVTLRHADGEAREAIVAVVPVGDESSRQFELRIALAEARWPVGSALQVGLPSADAREVVAVPRDALILRADETYVMRIAADDTAQRVVVESGDTLGDLVEVRGDIAPGDRLVVRGGERLQAGQRVRVDPPPAALAATH
ncbi:efflux RND transporter periplasmic adaptor subunit [Chiayiivirga flava]|uniref:RND family efflux transporter MFP subunit n=1 Tax=Chiayiivirga flava TaxID=659595 RepID=A0A7W8G073_9GAMM|nr:efflux RND transporter periplasmic adaptor subunit [Chiayiivirga flava]MBB5208881.1 RND family efflux transporter MFP subunit [Chiayiivirga flava]